MKRLSSWSAVLLGVSVVVGTACSQDDEPAASANVGGQGTGAAAGTGASAGSGTGGAGGASLTGIPTPNGYLTQGTLKGTTDAMPDTYGSTITLRTDSLCASGTVVQVPLVDGGYDYGAWGAGFGWYLNQEQLADGGTGTANGADLAAFSRVVVGLSGATGLSLRLGLVPLSPDGGFGVQYCKSLPVTGTGDAGFALSDLTESCWNAGGTAFNPATVQPGGVVVFVLSSTNAAQSFDLCITRLEFLP